MLVEHTFVTTMDAPDAMRQAAEFLGEFGFVAQADRAFQMGQTWNALEVRRGSTRRRWRSPMRDWPQQVRVEWDRGRVGVAASMSPPPRGRLDTSAGNVRRRDRLAVEQTLVTLARSIELLLVPGGSADQARAAWGPCEQQLIDQSARQRRRQRWILAFAIIFALLAVGGLIAAIMSTFRH